MRRLNHKLQELNEPFVQLTGTYVIACECNAPWCNELIDVPLETYQRLNADPDSYLVLSSHVDQAHVDVIGRGDGFAIVVLRRD
jgi:hypothetical protein